MKSAICEAALKGDLTRVISELESGVDVNTTEEDETGRIERVTPLMFASREGNIQIVNLLLRYKAQVNRKTRSTLPGDLSGETALHWAVRQKHKSIVRLLIESGADIDSQSSNGTVLQYAIMAKSTPWVRFLLDSGCAFDAPAGYIKKFPIHTAAMHGNAAIIEMLLKRGALQHADPVLKQTPLMICCFDGNADFARVLLRWKADVNAKCRDGWTPLMYASARGNEDCVKLLLKQNPDLLAKNSEGQTAWELAHEAAEARHSEGQTAWEVTHRSGAHKIACLLERRGGRTRQ